MGEKLPDVVLLDMDNTLYEYDPCHKEALIKVEFYLRKTIDIESPGFYEYYKKARHEINTRLINTASSHNRLLYFQRLLELCGFGTKVDLAMKLHSIYWETFINKIEVCEGVYQFLEHLKNYGISVVLITDLTADIQFQKIVRLNLNNVIDALVTSEEAGKEKPSKEIFEFALRKLNQDKQTVWVIGDNLSKDIAGGISIGAITFLKVHGKKNELPASVNVKPDFVFESFFELIDMVSELKSEANKLG